MTKEKVIKQNFLIIRNVVIICLCLISSLSITGELFFVGNAFANSLINLDEALQKNLPKASQIEKKTVLLSDEQKKSVEEKANVTFDPEFDKEFNFYTGRVNGQIAGYTAENTVQGKWGPIHYLVGFDLNGKITNIIVLSLNEKRGRPVAKPRFLNQFVGKTAKNQIRLRRDIQGITGATISSRSLTDGIRKMLYIFDEFRKTQSQ